MNSPGQLSRRDALAMLGAVGGVAAVGRASSADAQAPASTLDSALPRNDQAVRALLDTQITSGKPLARQRGGSGWAVLAGSAGGAR